MLLAQRATNLLRPTALVVALLAFSGAAQAATITFSGTTADLVGMGFGNVPPVLTLQTHGGEDSEWGFVAWNGSADVFSDPNSQVESDKSQTVSAADLLALGLTRDTFGLLFNLNQDSDSNVVVQEFSVDFYLADGSLSFSAVYTPPAGGLSLYPAEHGQGGAGWVFMLDLSTSEYDGFMGDGNNRMGITVAAAHAIGNASDGAESFTLIPIPEPTSLVLLSLGLLFVRRRRH